MSHGQFEWNDKFVFLNFLAYSSALFIRLIFLSGVQRFNSSKERCFAFNFTGVESTKLWRFSRTFSAGLYSHSERRWKKEWRRIHFLRGKDSCLLRTSYSTLIGWKDNPMLQNMSWRLFVLFMRFFKYRPPGIARRALNRMLRVAADFREEG